MSRTSTPRMTCRNADNEACRADCADAVSLLDAFNDEKHPHLNQYHWLLPFYENRHVDIEEHHIDLCKLRGAPAIKGPQLSQPWAIHRFLPDLAATVRDPGLFHPRYPCGHLFYRLEAHIFEDGQGYDVYGYIKESLAKNHRHGDRSL